MAATVSALQRVDPAVEPSGLKRKVAKITGDSSYSNGGYALTPSDFELNNILGVNVIQDPGGYFLFWDDTNGKLKFLQIAVPIHTGTIKDDDSASSNGTALTVGPADPVVSGYFESTTANNADAPFGIGSGGPQVDVNDNDTPVGVAVYFDENATDPARRFLAVVTGDHDLLVPVNDGSFIRIADDDSAASNGVAVYFDDNGATVDERLLFVSPTNADGTYDTYGEVPAGTDLSGVSFFVEVIGS